MSTKTKKSNAKRAVRPGGGCPETAKEKVSRHRILSNKWAMRLIECYEKIDWLKEIQHRASVDTGWWIRDAAGEVFGLPLVLECVGYHQERPGEFIKGDTPTYFVLDTISMNYVEAPWLYGPMWNPESRRLQEMLAEGTGLKSRLEQFEKENLQRVVQYPTCSQKWADTCTLRELLDKSWERLFQDSPEPAA